MPAAAYLPVNQLRAFPLLSAPGYAVQNGDVQVLQGRRSITFSPAQTGINGWPCNFGDTDGQFKATSNYLNVRGCSRFSLLVSMRMFEPKNDNQSGGGPLALSLYVQNQVQIPAGGTADPITDGDGIIEWPFSCSATFLHSGFNFGPGPWPFYNIGYKSISLHFTGYGRSSLSPPGGGSGVIRLWLRGSGGVAIPDNAFPTLYATLLAQS